MSAATELDHAGVGGPDLAALAASYERLGFTLTPYARHVGKATCNRCIMLRHGYLELIAPADPAIPDRLHEQLQRYHGLHMLALGIEDPAATLDRLRRAGLDIAGVTPLEVPDAVAGFALPLGRGQVRMLPAGALGKVYPGVTAPAVPCIAGMTVATADGCAALRGILTGLPHAACGAGVLGAPEAAGGAALLFT